MPRRRDFLRRGIFDVFRRRNKTAVLTRERKNYNKSKTSYCDALVKAWWLFY